MSTAAIRVGLVGYGIGGSIFHAPLIRSCSRMKLSAVLTSREAPERVESLDELLQSSDLIVIATPNQTHFPIARAAIEADKHVVIDKPFTVTVEQADELIDLARKRRSVLTAFHNRRWDGDFLTVRKMVPRLGEIYLFEAHWDRFRPAIKQGWREEGAVGGGLLNDLGPHMFDQALQLFGTPDAISADVLAQRPGANVDDYFDVTFHYASRRVCLRSSTLVSEPRPRFALHGIGGSFVKFGLDPQEEQLKNGLASGDSQFGFTDIRGTFTQPDGASESIATDRGNYPAFYDQVAGAILDGAPVPVDPADARTGLLLIDLARRAAEMGQRLPVPGASSPEG